MSGGVDSAVTAYLLKLAGHDVIGVTLRVWMSSDGKDSRCCEIDDARRVAWKLNMPYYVVSCLSEFNNLITAPFVLSYLNGTTPNPCVLCNRYIKWDKMLESAEVMGASHIATGHYASVVQKENGRFTVKRAKYAQKDQTYMLYRLTQEQLSGTIMPLGQLSKEEVRQIARSAGIPVAEKKDSQEICFVTDGNYSDYVEENAAQVVNYGGNSVDKDADKSLFSGGNFVDKDGNKSVFSGGDFVDKDADKSVFSGGNFVDKDVDKSVFSGGDSVDKDVDKSVFSGGNSVDKDADKSVFSGGNSVDKDIDKSVFSGGDFVDKDGNILGRHRGIIHYTVGQRKGLGLSLGYPVYVTKINAAKNEVVVGSEESLYSREVICNDLNFLSIPELREGERLRCTAKIRYHHKAQAAYIELYDSDKVKISFDEPVKAAAPGQSAVFYDDEDCVIGGGIII